MSERIMIASVSIREATDSDAGELLRVINDAFSVEQFFTPGPRLTPAELDGYLARGTFLIAEEAGAVAGCVYVEGSTPSGYFGLLSVDRTRQQRGIGRRLVAAAEDLCRSVGCDTVRIRVVNLRTELPPFYTSLGYSQTGTEKFESSNVTLLCHFIVMSKRL